MEKFRSGKIVSRHIENSNSFEFFCELDTGELIKLNPSSYEMTRDVISSEYDASGGYKLELIFVPPNWTTGRVLKTS